MTPNSQQKAVYSEIVLQAMKHIYTPKAVEMLKQAVKSQDPAEGIASVVSLVLKLVIDVANKIGHKVDKKFIVPAGKEILKHVMEMLTTFGDIPKQQAGQIMQQAMAIFVEIVGAKKQPSSGMLARGV